MSAGWLNRAANPAADPDARARAAGRTVAVMDSQPPGLVRGETLTVVSEPVGAGSSAGSRERGRSPEGPVQRITEARAPHSTEMARRMRTYAISMGVRTACVAGFVLLFPHWSAWLLVPGAALLPYLAVLLANAGREARPTALPRLSRTASQRALPAGPPGETGSGSR